MSITLPLAALASILVAAESGAIPPAPTSARADSVVAIVDVTVVPMDRERSLPGQTVVVRDGKIAQIGPAGRVSVPAGAVRVDGRGKWLMPGLIDMHAHAAPGAGAPTDAAGRQMALSLATGVTTVRGMGVAPQAAPQVLALRDRVARGELVGPAMVLYAPSIHGQNTTTPEQARQRVRDAKAAGYDGIKTHGGFGADVYEAMADEARKAGLPLAGHVTPGFGLERAIAAGQQVEHLDGVLAALMTGDAPVPGGQMIVDAADLARVDSARIPALAREMTRRGVVHGPTLALFEIVMNDETGDVLARRPEMRYVPPQGLQQWTGQKNMQLQNGAPAEGRARFLALRRALVRELHAAGAKMMAGSDSPQFFMTPGFGLHRELQALAAAGLSPYAALETATRVPAEYLGRPIGVVAEGKRADLLLLDADPLADVANASRVAGVMVGGRWLSGETLRARLAEVERAVRQ